MSSSLAIRGVVPASRLGERLAPATVSTGITELDTLTGGLPRGALSELCGPASSGRSSVLLAVMAETTSRGEVCALVDASDCFDPQSAVGAGVELRRLLWIRCSQLAVVNRRSPHGGQWSAASGPQTPQIANHKSQMNRLEQALKATDLLLQGGGFGLVVVDLGDLPPEVAQRVPLTSWFRFRRGVENTSTVLLVLEQEPHARSCASLVCKLSAIGSQLSSSRQSPIASCQKGSQRSAISTQPDDIAVPAHARVLRGLIITAEVLRSSAAAKKPARSTAAYWQSTAAWVG